MRRILYITLAIAFIFSTCAVPVSAASYQLSDPTLWVSPINNSVFSIFWINDEDTGEYVPAPDHLIPKMFFGYYPESYTSILNPPTPIWSIGDRSVFDNEFGILGNRFTGTSNILVSLFKGNVSDTFIIPGFCFSGVYLPSVGQYLKIDFSFDTRLFNPPSVSFLNPRDLFFLTPHHSNILYDRDFVPPSTVVYSFDADINVGHYTVYFDLSSSVFDEFADEYKNYPFDLIIRVPYYIYESEYAVRQVLMATDASFPSSYEILTVGGYSQEIEAVQNAVVKGFDDLDSILTDVDPDDSVIITQLEDKFDELDSTLDDYDDAMQPVFQMKDLYTHPPIASIIQSNTSQLDTSDVKDLFSVRWIVSAFSMIFAFCIIRLILFGTKEG